MSKQYVLFHFYIFHIEQKYLMNENNQETEFLQTKIHLHFTEWQQKLQIMFMQNDFIKIKKIQFTQQNLPSQVKFLFKNIKNLDLFLKQNPQSLKITRNNTPKLFVQYSLGKFVSNKIQLTLFPKNNDKQQFHVQNGKKLLFNSFSKISSSSITGQQSKVSALQNQISQKIYETQKLKKRIIELDLKIIDQQKIISSLKQKNKNPSEISILLNDRVNKTIQKAEKMIQNKHSQTASKCSEQRGTQKNSFPKSQKSDKGVNHLAVFKQNEMKRMRRMSTPNQGYSPKSVYHPVKIKLLISQFKIKDYFSVTDTKEGNKTIQKTNGPKLGHQIVFQNWIYRQGYSYFRFINRGIKNNFLFIGIILQNRKDQRVSFHSESCVSYNCSDGCIWSNGKSQQNAGIGEQLKNNQIITVLIDSEQKCIQWFINRKIVGIRRIDHLFSECNKMMKIHPYIQMQGVGDKIQIINDESTISKDLSIQNIIDYEYNKGLKQKILRKDDEKWATKSQEYTESQQKVQLFISSFEIQEKMPQLGNEPIIRITYANQ